MLLVSIIGIGICSNAFNLTEEQWTGIEFMIKKPWSSKTSSEVKSKTKIKCCTKNPKPPRPHTTLKSYFLPKSIGILDEDYLVDARVVNIIQFKDG